MLARCRAARSLRERGSPRPIGGFAHILSQGFTLIELLVVMAVVALLVALLLPAVQRVREAARMVECKNHLHQLAIAIQNYEGVYKMIPKGGYGGGMGSPALWDSAAGRAGRMQSWGTALLPYLEQKPLYDALDANECYLRGRNVSGGATVLSVYLCPTTPNASEMKPNGDNATHPLMGRNDYGGNWGERALRCFPATNCQNNYRDLNPAADTQGRGVILFAGERSIRMRHVTDGTSHTIAIGEAPNALHGLWIGHKNFFDQSAPLNARFATSGQTPFQSCLVANNSPNVGKLGCDFGQEFHSYHEGGVQFCLLDASVHFLSESLDLKVLAALLSRCGEEANTRF